jgi:hypothetical protein
MAVGLVIDVWRNSPVEDMHCGKRGPDDAAMFAESTSLHEQAVTALTAANRPVGLLELPAAGRRMRAPSGRRPPPLRAW